MTNPIPVPIFKGRKPLKHHEILRYRSLLAFQLRSMMFERSDIAAILQIPEKNIVRYIESGRRVIIDGVIMTVIP